jgi:hypothetical protein
MGKNQENRLALCPQIPIYFLLFLHALIASSTILLQPRLFHFEMPAMPELSRSNPKVNWVKSFDPIENPSKTSKNFSAIITLLGISHIT